MKPSSSTNYCTQMEMAEAKAATDEQKSPQEPLKPAAPWNDQDRGLQDKEEGR